MKDSIQKEIKDTRKKLYFQRGRQCGKTAEYLMKNALQKSKNKDPKEATETRKNFDAAKLTKYSNMILAEYRRAKELHPLWPDKIIHAAAIMAEKSGETVRAALKMQRETDNIEEVEKALIETATMCLRCLVNLEK